MPDELRGRHGESDRLRNAARSGGFIHGAAQEANLSADGQRPTTWNRPLLYSAQCACRADTSVLGRRIFQCYEWSTA